VFSTSHRLQGDSASSGPRTLVCPTMQASRVERQWATLRSVLKDLPEAVNHQAAQDDLKRDARDTHDESDSDDKYVLEQYAER
jgi:hypothetical protein